MSSVIGIIINDDDDDDCVLTLEVEDQLKNLCILKNTAETDMLSFCSTGLLS